MHVTISVGAISLPGRPGAPSVLVTHCAQATSTGMFAREVMGPLSPVAVPEGLLLLGWSQPPTCAWSSSYWYRLALLILLHGRCILCCVDR